MAVTDMISHPNYIGDRNDIALLKLADSVEFTDYVRPACIATDTNETEVYSNCMAAGWGSTQETPDCEYMAG